MTDVRSGVSAALLPDVSWRRSRHSGAVGNCVELARLHGDQIAVRHSRHPDGPALVYTRAEMAAFIAGAKEGEFDDFLV
ncbi:DUF397 domain-containing protein [Gandjariella thermophila]|uniref:Transcriptional regulator n=1 Tax=Gandjariella thermophila TaxID=1931992 RepID=A0A4D4J898_9PSEU|nr:DUF397 domain-containing protein [Gandjariella thermophila]GDY32881.1 transcriptional regulator [Gandjariella thermophila]